MAHFLHSFIIHQDVFSVHSSFALVFIYHLLTIQVGIISRMFQDVILVTRKSVLQNYQKLWSLFWPYPSSLKGIYGILNKFDLCYSKMFIMLDLALPCVLWIIYKILDRLTQPDSTTNKQKEKYTHISVIKTHFSSWDSVVAKLYDTDFFNVNVR